MDFLAAVETRHRALTAAGRRVVLCGDWNVAPALSDSAYAQDTAGGGRTNINKPNQTKTKRKINQARVMSRLVNESSCRVTAHPLPRKVCVAPPSALALRCGGFHTR